MTHPRLAEWADLVDAEVPDAVDEPLDADRSDPPEGRFVAEADATSVAETDAADDR